MLLDHKSLDPYSTFSITIIVRIISLDEDSKSGFSILLNEEGEIPSFVLDHSVSIDKQLTDFLSKFIHDQNIQILYATKTISDITIDRNIQNVLNISYNLISNNKTSKSGKFVKFDKKNIELYRFANSNR